MNQKNNRLTNAVRNKLFNRNHDERRMKKIIKKEITFLLAFSVLCTNNGMNYVAVNAKNKDIVKDYVIVANHKKSYNKAVAIIGEENINTNGEISDTNNMIAARLSQQEVQELKQEGDYIVEEDLLLEANKRKEDSKKKEELYKLLEKKESKSKEKRKPEWNLQAINVDEVSETDNVKKKVKVAVLDSGIDSISGIDLKGSVNLVESEDYVATYYQDLTGHGTNIASVIVGNSDGLIQGVNPNVELYSVKVLDENNQAPISRIIEGIYWCIENDINIINMSFGTSKYSKALQKVVEDAYNANILMVAAAGNNDSEVEYPAAFEEVMAVAATNTKSEISDFSNTGEELDVAAPGEKIRVTGFFGMNGITHGTSIAVPQVVGVASLLWKKDLSKTNEFIRQLIDYSSKNIDNTNDCGLLDAGFALKIYDEFERNYKGMGLVNEKSVSVNEGEVETFDEIEDNSSYVEGRWKGEAHKDLVEKGAYKNGVTDSTSLAVLKAGAVYPDRADSGMQSLSYNPEYHGGYTAEYGGNNDVNYIACYEFVTRIALKNGDASSITNHKVVMGLGKNSYNWMKPDFTGKGVGSLTWSKIFSNIKVNGKSVAVTNKNKKYFTWGIALHMLGDTFAHKTCRKSDKKRIVHEKDFSNPNTQIIGADNSDVVKGRWVVAKAAIDFSIDCLLTNNYGNWAEISNALEKQTEKKNSELFLKRRLSRYVEENGGIVTSYEKNANID